MYCARCGTELETDVCPTCGGTEVASIGVRDPETSLVLASWGLRVLATLVDYVVLILPELLIYTIAWSSSSLLARVMVIVLQGVYLVWLLAKPNGQTIGNRFAKTKVVNARTGRTLTFSQSLQRWLFIALFTVVFAFVPVLALLELLDVLWPLWDKRNQTLHDKFAQTLVVMV